MRHICISITVYGSLFAAQFPVDQNTAPNLIFDLPGDINDDASNVSGVAYFVPLRGPKLLFTRTSAANAAETKKLRAHLRLISRPPTNEESEAEKVKLSALCKVDVPIIEPITTSSKSSRAVFQYK